MSYVQKNLMTGENVIYNAKLHWIIFLWPGIFFLLALLSIAGGASGGSVFLFLLAILSGICAYINYTTSEFALTNKRVIVKVGLIRRKSFEVLLQKIEGISVHQGLLGRILDYGTIVAGGTGGSKDPFHKICSPLEFRKNVQEQIDLVQHPK